MPAGSRLNVESRAGAAFELLIGLSVLCDPRRDRDDRTWVPTLRECPGPLRRAVERVGDGAGETWLHLLGLGLELPAGDAREFVAGVEAVDEHEFRWHLVGVHVPAWRSIVGAETLERAAARDRRAIDDLLASDRYYGGHARAALSVALPLTARQTKRRFVDVLNRFVDVFAPHERELLARLEADAQRRRAAAASASPEGVIATATIGYVYEPEPEFRRVVLIPHVAAGSSLLLCQHRDARIICHPAEAELRAAANVETRALALGKALADPARIAILRRLTRGEASLTELADVAGLAKSTAHHHLSSLRAARLVTVRGNARGYWYSLRLEGATEARTLLGELLRA
jgi:DNA-binding transcriptional ArsR family regulator